MLNLDKILYIEDDDESYLLLSNLLRKLSKPQLEVTRCTRLGSLHEFAGEEWQLILCDLTLPDSDPVDTFPAVQALYPYSPVIILTGLEELSLATQTIKWGAQDYLVKGDITARLLEKSIVYAVERKGILNDYRNIFENSPAPMYIFRRSDFRILAANNAATVQYGYSTSEFLSKTSLDIRPEEAIPFLVEGTSIQRTNYFNAGRTTHRRSNGEEFPVQVFAKPIRFKGQDAFIVLAHDISREAAIESALASKAAEIEDILNRMTDAFVTTNRNHEITYVNNEFERITGFSRSAILGRRLEDFFPVQENRAFYADYEAVLHDGTPRHLEAWSEQLKRWISCRIYSIETGIAAYFVDISAQKATEEALVLAEQNLRAIINNTGDIIWSVDRDLNIISANDAFWERIKRITGGKTDGLTAASFNTQLFDRWKSVFETALKGTPTAFVWQDEVDGQLVFEEIRINPIKSDDGTVTGISCFSRDVTELRQQVQQIEKQNERLREIAWIQSHKVRNQVATILGLVQLLDKSDPDRDVHTICDGIKSSAEQLDLIIRDINSQTSHPEN